MTPSGRAIHSRAQLSEQRQTPGLWQSESPFGSSHPIYYPDPCGFKQLRLTAKALFAPGAIVKISFHEVTHLEPYNDDLISPLV
jgi:hypothetical protein